ncbi:hypothetical protein NF867_00765 [Solitalea sp. MAHUQ-68]|uniref:Uncharacterized protein n=1 Tax=Solitalea agri TaxID=2953739 RepID=A0A9X2F2Y0_9SPHI|nr:hypothetical protein [Solitalea agri]MCO4291391.1 hypothetical protein [Solitalea agri]
MLLRQEDRKKRLPGLLENLSAIANKQFSDDDVLSIEQIDEHQIQLNSSDFDFNFLNISFPVDKSTDLLKRLLTIKEKLSLTNYFSLSNFSDIAVFNIKTDFVIDNFEDIIKLDNDTFSLYDHNYKNGLWIDLFQEYWYIDNKTQFIWIYELRVFGTEWIKLINEKL